MILPVVVVGDGASATLATVALTRRGIGPVLLIGSGATPGAGLAYRTTEPLHLLNSRAATMSADSTRPTGLIDWCRAVGRPIGPSGFLPRRRYGRYLAATLDATGYHDLVPGRAVAVRHTGDQVEITLGDGRRIAGRAAVLATGHDAPAPPLPGPWDHPRASLDPWRPGALDRAATADRVLLVGTGLTAVDAALAIHRRHPDARIVAISRHGLLPTAHRAEPAPPVRLDRVPRGLPDLLAAVRAAIAAGADWRAVVDGLRCDADRIWATLPPPARRRFIAHVDRYWQVHRHRMAPPVARAVTGLRESGALTVLAGRLDRFGPSGDGLVAVTDRGRELPCGALLNCTGPGRWATGTDPLAASVRSAGLARLDDTGVGLCCDPAGRTTPSSPLFVLGPPRLGGSWETTAIPEIRAQADAIADALATAAVRQPVA
ncbi:FAD/NAD(P)-binding protein [Actinocatenispora comari]|uniref:FAD-dependent urate hydroxylase HpyO/Asp monooxygenase CreE-like FAD/NAD(P)-binding domain-containing protein n=1 Tax=Actinocatenispora comari TaxID=2807577 RepID=A0A8J4AHH9_9ACTN|nr:FAD/NAD(P)-binding protein [Actinocatenispora comari]GIL29645.1 hypothetical protein NUM_48990 [Actinocatenispora comari]